MLNHSLDTIVHLKTRTADGIFAIYVNTALRKFGVALVGIFFPVFLFLRTQEVFADYETLLGGSIALGIYGVSAYFFLWQFVKLWITIPTANFLNKHGFRRTIAIGNILLAVLLVLLTLAETYYSLLFLAAIVHAFSTSFYWISYHTLFGEDGVVDKLGKEVSISKLIERFSSIAGPAIGGVILTFWGFQALFSVALIVVLLSIIPFFFMKHHKHGEKVTLARINEWIAQPTHRNEMIGILGRHIDNLVAAIFFPLFAFTTLGTFAKQGLVEAIALGLGALSIFAAGRIFDKKRSRQAFSLGNYATIVLTLLRGLSVNFGQLLAFESIRKIASPFYWVTFDSLWYRKSKSKGEGVLMFAVINQIFGAFATFIVILVAVSIARFEWRFWGMWIVAVVGIYMASALWKKGNKYE